MASGRRRVVASKPTRNGCRTCRFRRVKCDEDRPSCRRCTSTGRQCDGYDVGPPSLLRPAAVRTLLPLENGGATPLPLTRVSIPGPNALGSLDDSERFAFDKFLRETADGIRQLSPEKEWVQLALQLSQQAPPVTLAITALGFAHRAQLGITHTTLVQPLNPEHHGLALRQYSRAIAALQSHIHDSERRQASLEPLLVTCLLLATLEVFHGRGSTALSHIRAGRRIIQGRASPSGSINMTHCRGPGFWSQGSAKQITGIFQRLDDALFRSPRTNAPEEPLGLNVCTDANALFRYGGMFTSTVEARKQLQRLMAAVEEIRAELLRIAQENLSVSVGACMDFPTRYGIIHCLARTVNLQEHTDLRRRIEALADALSTWEAACAYIKKRQERTEERLVLSMMHVQHFFAFFTLATCRDTKETRTDRFIGDFTGVLYDVEQILEISTPLEGTTTSSEATPSPHTSEKFNVESSILPVLNLICFKCRDPDLRRRAISLLRGSNRQEGLLRSGTLAAHAEAVLKIEEGRARSCGVSSHDCLQQLTFDMCLPEAARFAEVILAPDLQGREGHMRFICGRFEDDKKIHLVEYSGCGYPIHTLQVNELSTDLEQGTCVRRPSSIPGEQTK